MYGPMINICEKLNDTRHFRALQNNLREKKAQCRRNKNSVRVFLFADGWKWLWCEKNDTKEFMRNENLSRCPELHLYISKKETSNIRSKRRKRQSDLRGFFFITKNEENHFRYPKSLPNIKMDSMGGIRKKKAERPESFLLKKKEKLLPGTTDKFSKLPRKSQF